MVGRDDEPRSVRAARVFNRVLVCLDVLRPVNALGKVGFADLPMLVRISEAFRKPARLLVAADVQKELENRDVIVSQRPFKVDNLLEALLHQLVGYLFVYARHQYIFIVRAIENADGAKLWNGAMRAPQKIVSPLERGGNFEGSNVARLWIDAGKDVTDGAVFSCRIHPLQHDKHSMSAISREQLLQLVKPLTMLFKVGGRFFLVAVASGVVGGEMREFYFLMRLDQVGT